LSSESALGGPGCSGRGGGGGLGGGDHLEASRADPAESTTVVRRSGDGGKVFVGAFGCLGGDWEGGSG